jgi:Putative addiction module component
MNTPPPNPTAQNEQPQSAHDEWVIARLKERLALIESGKATFISHEEVVRTARESLKARLQLHHAKKA